MLERFTERAREVVILAQEEARLLGHGYIATEHLLLGLLREQEGLAARALESLDITAERVRAQVVDIVGSGEEVTSGEIPFTPQAKKVFELALREALSLGHNHIGTEHVLLAMVHEWEDVAYRRAREDVGRRILLDFDVEPEKVPNEVIRMSSGADAVITFLKRNHGLMIGTSGQSRSSTRSPRPHQCSPRLVVGIWSRDCRRALSCPSRPCV